MTLADLLRGIPPEMRALAAADPHLPFVFDAVVRAKHHDVKVAERKARRAMLGCCDCGFARGEDYCPICEGIIGALGRHLRDQGSSLAEIVEAERVIVASARDYTAAGMAISPRRLAAMGLDVALRTETKEKRADAVDVLAALTKKTTGTPGSRPRNRFERRREASRRWKR